MVCLGLQHTALKFEKTTKKLCQLRHGVQKGNTFLWLVSHHYLTRSQKWHYHVCPWCCSCTVKSQCDRTGQHQCAQFAAKMGGMPHTNHTCRGGHHWKKFVSAMCAKESLCRKEFWELCHHPSAQCSLKPWSWLWILKPDTMLNTKTSARAWNIIKEIQWAGQPTRFWMSLNNSVFIRWQCSVLTWIYICSDSDDLMYSVSVSVLETWNWNFWNSENAFIHHATVLCSTQSTPAQRYHVLFAVGC